MTAPTLAALPRSPLACTVTDSVERGHVVTWCRLVWYAGGGEAPLHDDDSANTAAPCQDGRLCIALPQALAPPEYRILSDRHRRWFPADFDIFVRAT